MMVGVMKEMPNLFDSNTKNKTKKRNNQKKSIINLSFSP